MAQFYNILLQAHSGWRYLVIVLVLAALIKFVLGWWQRSRWGGLDGALARFTPIVLDIQLLLGLLLVIVKLTASSTVGVLVRQHWEHLGILLVAVVAAHLVTSRIRKATTDMGKFRLGAIGYIAITVLLILGIVPLTGWNIFA